MKTKSRLFLIVFLMALVMLVSSFAVAPFTANAAGGTEKVDFAIKEPFDVYFETTGSHNNYPVTLNNENKLSVPLPTLYRTDTLDFVFDGWYIANSDIKITQDYVFDGYTVLVDKWTYSEFDSNYKVSNIEIKNPELTIGTKQGEYTADVAIANVDGITQNSGVNFTIYKGLNKSGDPLVGDETIEIGKNYSAVTTITLKDGYKFDDQLKFTSDNGLCADWKYRGNFFENNWSTLATQVEVVINFVGDNEYYFSQQPESLTLENYSEYHYWYALQEPDDAESLDSVVLQYKQQDESWALFGPATNVVSPYADRTITFRLLADYGVAGYIYSEPWTITWTKVNGTIDNIQLGVTSPKENGTPSYAKANSDPRYYQAYENNATTQNGIKWSGSVSGDLEVANAIFNKTEDYTVSIKLVAQEGYSFDIANLTATINANNAQVTGTSEEVTVTYTFEKEAVKTYNVYFGSGVHGTGIMETASVNEGEEYELPACAFTPITNYQFSSWSVSGQLMMPGDTITITDNITIFAIWQSVSTPVAEGFTTQPTGGTTATGAVFTAQFVVNESIQYNSVNVLRYNSETDNWSSFNSSNGLTTISNGGKIVGVGFSNSSKASEILRIYAYRDGNCVAKSEIFTVNWVDCEFTEQPQGSKVIVGSTYTFTWKTNFAVTRYRILCFDGENWNAIAETTGNSCSVTADTEKSLTYQVCADMSYIMSNGNINYRFDIAKSQAFVVTWEDNEVIFSYCTNGAEGSNEIGYATVGEEITLDDCTFTAPAGKKFKAWAIGSVNGEQKQPGEKITITEETYIYAIWEDNEVIYSYCTNGAEGSNEIGYATVGEEITLDDCTFTAPAGKKFKAWAIGSVNGALKQPGEKITITEETYIYAIWEDPPVATGLTASYNGTILAGNKLAINQLTVKLQYSDSSEMPCAGLCEYWYNGSIIDDPINYVFGEELIGTITITVKYQGFETTFDVQVVGYEITFNANGGTGVMAGDERVGEYTLPACTFTAPSGKQFKGWATSASGDIIGATYTLTANVEFFAIWEDIPVVKYDVTFNANGGTGTMSPVEYAGTYTLPTCAFTAPDGKQFKGWATSANGEVIDGVTYNVTVNVELFAIWEDIPHNHDYGTAWESDANGHWNECACGDKANEGAHVDQNTDGTCDTCGWVDPNFTPVVPGPGEGGQGGSTPDNTPDNTPDTTPEVEGEDEAGLSGGAIAGIAVGATVGAVGLGAGGFAIFWFVIKKKSMAELLAIFKKAPKATPNTTPDIPTGNDDITE